MIRVVLVHTYTVVSSQMIGVVVVESLPDNVVSQETGDTDEDDGFTTVTHKRGKAARAAAAAKSPPAPAVPATSIPSLLTLQTAPLFTSAAGAGAQQSKRQAHAKSAPQQARTCCISVHVHFIRIVLLFLDPRAIVMYSILVCTVLLILCCLLYSFCTDRFL